MRRHSPLFLAIPDCKAQGSLDRSDKAGDGESGQACVGGVVVVAPRRKVYHPCLLSGVKEPIAFEGVALLRSSPLPICASSHGKSRSAG